MTAVAGYTDGETMVLGADSFATQGCEGNELRDPKVWRAGEAIFGGSGTPRALQIARYGMEALGPRPHESEMDTLYRWANAYREKLHALRVPVDGKEDAGIYILLGWRGFFYEVQGNGSILSFPGAIGVSGCGGSEARAAMRALLGFPVKINGRDLVKRGLEAAAAYNTHVRGPFHFVEIKVRT